MKKALFLAFCLSMAITAGAQNATVQPELIKYIDVTGKAEMEIEPDEITFVINITEYWKEEFDKKVKVENFKTKVPLAEIENDLVTALLKAGVKKEEISVREVGGHGRRIGKDFLNSKRYELKLKNFKVVDNIIKTVDTRGIDYMNITELKNDKIGEYRLDCKVKALQAAHNKAKVLVEAIGEELGEVLTIDSSNEGSLGYSRPEFMNVYSAKSRSFESDAAVGGAMDIEEVRNSIDNIRKIKLNERTSVRFRIK